MSRWSGWVSTCVISGALFTGMLWTSASSAAADKPADKPATKPATPATLPATQPVALSPKVQDAITALIKEYEAVKADPLKAPPRVVCNYFGKTAIPQDQIIAALSKDLSPDPVTEAYVKWQLLSGFKGVVTEQNASVIVAQYKPLQRLPINIRTDPQIVRMLAIKAQSVRNAEQAAQLNDAWKQEIAKFDAMYGHLALYRNELFRCLPKNRDAIVAGLTDLQQRALAGWESLAFAKMVTTETRIWATPLEAKEYMPILSKMKELSTMKGATGFGEYTWDAKKSQGKFKPYVGAVDSRTMLSGIDAIKNAFK